MTEMTLGQKLASCRKSFSWSQHELARYLEISQYTISVLESDLPSCGQMAKALAKLFIRMVDAGLIRPSDLPPRKPKTEGAPK